jgi:hypothetical protein
MSELRRSPGDGRELWWGGGGEGGVFFPPDPPPPPPTTIPEPFSLECVSPLMYSIQAREIRVESVNFGI